MVTTRSRDKQTHLEDFAAVTPSMSLSAKKTRKPTAEPQKRAASKDTGIPSPPPSPDRKRKASSAKENASGAKKTKYSKSPANSETIIINRAPVLHLWSACVTHFLYPKLEWSTCLSAGSAISAITAIAKGRSIGTVDEPKDTPERQKKKAEQKEKSKDYQVLEVMQFKLQLKDGKVVFSGKPQSHKEETLRKKYEDRYADVKGAFDEALKTWVGRENELQDAGFRMYEEFRPAIPKGQRGWGRKGELDLNSVRKVVAI